MTRTAIKFGMFVALCLTFTVLLASTIGNTTIGGLVGRGPSTYTVSAAFSDVTGLLIDDNVKISGVPVGKVTGIDVESGMAMVSMQIDDEYRVPADTSATIRWRNLIGQRYVYLVPGDAPVSLEDGGRIERTSNVVDLGELFNRLGPIVAAVDESQVNEFLETVNAALEGNEEKISQALDDLAFVVKNLGQRDQSIGRLIENLEVVSRTVADRDAQIETMLDNLAALANTFSDNTALLETAILEMGAFGRDLSSVLVANRGELDGILTKLDNTLNTVETQLGPLGESLDMLDDTAAGIFNTSRNGEFLNQAILCLATQPPPCPSPIVTGLDGVAGQSGSSVVRFRSNRGADAILSLVVGDK